MSKFKFTLDNQYLRGTTGIIFGGACMIALALMCKKLDIPVEVLTDPFSGPSIRYRPVGSDSNDTSVMMVPNNSTEASIAAICDRAKKMPSSYEKMEAVKKIMKVIEKHEDLLDSTKTFAIMCIRAIASTTHSQYYVNLMMDEIAKLA